MGVIFLLYENATIFNFNRGKIKMPPFLHIHLVNKFSETRIETPVCRVWQNSTRSLANRANHKPRAPLRTRLFIPEYGCMPRERLSIRKMRVLGAFPAVLDDLNFKFSRGSMPPDPPCMFMLYRSVHSKAELQTRLQTNYQSIHSCTTSLY